MQTFDHSTPAQVFTLAPTLAHLGRRGHHCWMGQS